MDDATTIKALRRTGDERHSRHRQSRNRAPNVRLAVVPVTNFVCETEWLFCIRTPSLSEMSLLLQIEPDRRVGARLSRAPRTVGDPRRG